MRIDSHQHFWKYDPREYDWIDDRMNVLKRDFLPEHLRPELARLGFAAGGLVTSLLVTQLEVVPFIVTLGMMLLVRGATKGLVDERRIEAPTTWLNAAACAGRRGRHAAAFGDLDAAAAGAARRGRPALHAWPDPAKRSEDNDFCAGRGLTFPQSGPDQTGASPQGCRFGQANGESSPGGYQSGFTT